MPFDQILGQETASAFLRNALTHGRLAHAYLFVGPEGVGKKLTALTLAKAMNCQDPPRPGDCCERCPSCLKVNSQNHADVIVVEAAGDVLKIEQVRNLQKRLSYKPLEGGRRACLIDPADKMNEAAANALLKTLEEPPEGTYLFLITAKPHQLLPTILSRCQWVKFKPLAVGHLVAILKETGNLEEEKAHFCASLSGGSAGKALAMSNRLNFQKRLEWLESFAHLPEKSTEEIFAGCERMVKEEEEVEEGLELLQLWVRDLMVWKIEGGDGEKRLINQDLKKVAAQEAEKYSLEQLDSLFSLIADAQKALARNANRQLALETAFFEMKKTMSAHPRHAIRVAGEKETRVI